MKNILITGGAGFIGTSLCLRLLKDDYKITVIDNFSEQIHGSDYKNSALYKLIEGKVEIIHASVSDQKAMSKAMEGKNIIVHYAAETGTGQSMYDINHYCNVNIQATAQMLDYITNEENQIKKIVVASSRSIYGEGKYRCSEHGEVFPKARKEEDLLKKDFKVKCPTCQKDVELLFTDETSKIHPASIYGITKQVQEQMITLMGESLGISTIGLRYQNVYGPGQSLKNPYTGILSIFSTRILNNNPINIFEDGQESRDFVYIDDVVEATYLAINSDRKENEVYNVGTGIGVTVEEVTKQLYKSYGKEENHSISGNFRLGDIRHNIADLSKIKNNLGFSPRVSFEEGINRFCDWVKGQEVEEDRFQASLEEMKKKGLLK